MIEKFFKKFINRGKGKPFSAWQIELTTKCSLRCKMCIRSETEDWEYKDMPFEDFKKILPYLRDVENVILEGWGESLLYKDLIECIRLVKKEGSQVGFVTSGKGLNEDRVSELIEAGLDFIGFSIAGIKPETHAGIRVNSNLSEILSAIQFFTEEKRRRGIDRPKMHLVFLMLKDNIREIPDLPIFAKEIGINEVFLINIIHITNPSLNDQKVFSYEEGESHFDPFLKEAEANARRLMIKLKRPALFPIDVPICEENPLENLYISVDGEVSPCVYLYPPLPSPFKRIFFDRVYSVEKLTFGNLFEESFYRIWNSQNYQSFRNCFIERKEKLRELYFSPVNSSERRDFRSTFLQEPPEACKTCHKILGV